MSKTEGTFQRVLWLAWHPVELFKLAVGSFIIGVLIIVSYVKEAIDEANR